MSITIVKSPALRALQANEGTKDPQELRKLRLAAVNEVVGQVFFGTLMREFRSSQDVENPLSGGRAGATFTGALDQLLLQRLAGSSRFQVGQALAKSWFGLEPKEPITARSNRNAG